MRHTVKKLAKLLPPFLEQRAVAMEEYARGLVTGGTLFDELGFFYVGPIDGHNIGHLLPVLKNVREAENGPFLIHIVTQKGKGYPPAENSADKYHGVVKFDVVTGVQVPLPRHNNLENIVLWRCRNQDDVSCVPRATIQIERRTKTCVCGTKRDCIEN